MVCLVSEDGIPVSEDGELILLCGISSISRSGALVPGAISDFVDIFLFLRNQAVGTLNPRLRMYSSRGFMIAFVKY